MSFDSLGLNQKILDAVSKQGYQTPSPIQAQAIPAILNGSDVMAAAQTGTGKTAGFTLPIIELLFKGQAAKSNHARALIVTPTRELAIQVAESVSTYSQNTALKSAVVYGGVKINPQMMKLRKGVDILIATPGRLLDLYNQNAVKFEQLEILVLDEADRMLDMGFIRDIKKIISLLPAKRQNLLFSATFSDEIRALAKGLVNDPIEISVTPRNTTVSAIKQRVFPVDKKRKSELLSFLIGSNNWQQVLVFTRTKHGANRLTKHLIADGIKSMAIHGNKSQGARVKALTSFKENKIQVLVATDIAARGIDISELPHVVNFDLPNVPEDYVHRIGRTGRAGRDGEAVSLVSADEFKQLSAIEKLIQKVIDRKLVDGFEPNHDVPTSRLDLKPSKPKKPKKNKFKSFDNNRTNGPKPANRNSQRRRKPKPKTAL
jgi:ATP-dependent RNA helicase RhlE